MLGDPIAHSLSPLLHSEALAATGLAGTYQRRRVDAAGMAQAVAEIRDGELDGANVTMPHKELAAKLCDRLAATARRAGAVNTLVRVGGAVVGHNTDIVGIQAAWSVAELPYDAPVLVLGAGGAAAAALLAVEGRAVSISARRPAAAHALTMRTGVAAAVQQWGEAVAGAVVVNATPVGMGGEALDAALLEPAAGLFDMAYGPTVTLGVKWMEEHGRPVADGRLMLLHQAAAAFELWTGHCAPVAQMAAALAAIDTID